MRRRAHKTTTARATPRTVGAPETAGLRAEVWSAALLDARDEGTVVVPGPCRNEPAVVDWL